MHIGFDAAKAFIDSNYHGNYSQSVIQVLSQNHPENQYILYSPRISKSHLAQQLISPPHVKVRTPANIVSKMKMGNIWRSTILGNTALKDGVNVFHGLTNELPIVISKKLKTVVTIHNLHFIRYPHLYNTLDLEIFKRRYRHSCTVANKIVATSQQTAEDLNSFLGVNPDKISVIPQTCHPAFKKEYAPFELGKICEKYKLPEDFLLATSQPDVFNNNALMSLQALVAIKNTVDVPLVVVGKIHKKYKQEILELAKKEKMSNRLILLEEVSVKDLAMIFQLCKLYIYAGTFPCDTTPIKEALYSNVPVLCSRIPEFIEAGGLSPIYIKTGNTEELAYTIQNVLNNPSLASNMIYQGESQIPTFSDEVVSDKLNSLYKALSIEQTV